MPRFLTAPKLLVRKVRELPHAINGNVAIVFALCLLPLVGLVGFSVDYGIALTDKSRLDHAADAAAIAAVAAAKAYVAANSNDPNVSANALTAGLTQAYAAFAVNAGAVPFATVAIPTINLTRTGLTFKSSVLHSATTQNHFGQLFGVPTFRLSGGAAASADVTKYLDFYLMVDVSGSMGLPATSSGMTQLANVNMDMYSDYKQGCQFACHFPGEAGWGLAAGKIQLRSDAVNSAVCSLLQQASSPAVPNQYRIGIYPFINQLATLSAITSNMAIPSAAAQCGSDWPSGQMAFTNLLDTGTTQLATGGDPSTGTGSGGTHFEIALPQMKATISPYGDGSSASASSPFVFLVTDGMENGQHYFSAQGGQYAYPGNPSNYPGYSPAWWDGSQPAQIDPNQCNALKTAGATIAILYIPYNQIIYTDYGGGVAWENAKVNGLSPTLGQALQQCASNGFFYTANSPADITNALNAMFTQATQVAHLTQ